MRLSFVILAAMVVITGTAATNSESASIPTKELEGGIDALNTAQGGVKGKWLLCGYRDGEEERLSRQALNDLLDGNTLHKFEKWASKGYSGKFIYKKLDISTHTDRLWIYNKYLKHLNEN
ncbi:hypothetical protein PHPALM_30035 [Phytophthora palmivora]|uniref:RxLR effector protein n=1 Tax=Phytophthora palmivora TaxID=4796 RepID=A0A2P4X662_9STRA|nr:hypothetical protein PHPALM_30035 [Phytophthora palmivora]